MRDVVACGYLGLSSPDLGAWRDFGTALGMELAGESDAKTLRFRVDEQACRIAIEEGEVGPSNGVAYVGWEVASDAALGRVVDRLRAARIEVSEAPDLAKERQVEQLVRCLDPGGNQFEFYVGAINPQKPFVSPTGTRFVTSDKVIGDLGLGHVVTSYSDAEAAYRFYADVLGFSLSDICYGAQARWYFMRVNPRHHSVAFAQYAVPSAYHHFMLQVEDMDMVGACEDRLRTMGAPFTATLGRHNNDRMVSFYVRTPSGIEVEYGHDAILVDDATWKQQVYEGATIWGHHFLPG